jgi:hypothetical protein
MGANSQNFESLTSQIFFNVDTKKRDTTLLSDFKLLPELLLQEKKGWTSYPPDVDIDDIPILDIFAFSKHPYFKSGLENGDLIVYTDRQSAVIKGMSLLIFFRSVSAIDSTYKNIRKLYRKCASKVIKRPDMVKSHETTKYLSKDGSDFVIITKGRSDSKPYLHIAFNYQGYSW